MSSEHRCFSDYNDLSASCRHSSRSGPTSIPAFASRPRQKVALSEIQNETGLGGRADIQVERAIRVQLLRCTALPSFQQALGATRVLRLGTTTAWGQDRNFPDFRIQQLTDERTRSVVEAGSVAKQMLCDALRVALQSRFLFYRTYRVKSAVRISTAAPRGRLHL